MRAPLSEPGMSEPRIITIDKNAAYPPAIANLKAIEALPETTKTRQSKFLNNTVEQDCALTRCIQTIFQTVTR